MQLRDFLELLGKETGLEASELEILAGFPPAPIQLPSDPGSTLSSSAIANGDTLLVRRREKAASTAQEDAAPDATASNVAEVLFPILCIVSCLPYPASSVYCDTKWRPTSKSPSCDHCCI